MMQPLADHREQFILSLDEEALRQVILIPLLSRLGYRDVLEYHGSVEKGKDIICWYSDPMQRRRYLAVVVKHGDIHGAVGKAGNASEVLYQVQQAFNEPYRDVYDLNALRIDECLVVASGKIKNSAVESISGTLRGTNLDLLLHFMDAPALAQIVTRAMPEFWFSDQTYLQILHDMRSMLSSIAGHANVLEHYGEKLSGTPDRLREVGRSIAHTAELAQRLLESRYYLDRRNLNLQVSTHDIGSIVHETITLFSELVRRRQSLKIEYRQESQIRYAQVDPRAFRDALSNILHNAIRYSHTARPIEVITCESGDDIIVRVRNYGPPVAENFEELIFQPFYSGSPHGPGLGLFIARKVVTAMGGRVQVTNRSNPTEFSIYVPRGVT